MAKWKADNNVDVVNIKASVKAGNIKFYIEEGCIICASCNNSDRVTVGKAITKELPYEYLSPLARLGIDELNRREEDEENEVATCSDRGAGVSSTEDK